MEYSYKAIDEHGMEFSDPGGTLGWVKYDRKTQAFQDDVQVKDLVVNANLAKKFNDCLQYCDFSQNLALQEQYKDKNVVFVIQNEIIGTHAKERAYFYSAPNERCKINNLFLIPKDRFNLLQNRGEFSFVAYKRKNGEILKLWIKSDRVKR